MAAAGSRPFPRRLPVGVPGLLQPRGQRRRATLRFSMLGDGLSGAGFQPPGDPPERSGPADPAGPLELAGRMDQARCRYLGIEAAFPVPGRRFWPRRGAGPNAAGRSPLCAGPGGIESLSVRGGDDPAAFSENLGSPGGGDGVGWLGLSYGGGLRGTGSARRLPQAVPAPLPVGRGVRGHGAEELTPSTPRSAFARLALVFQFQMGVDLEIGSPARTGPHSGARAVPGSCMAAREPGRRCRPLRGCGRGPGSLAAPSSAGPVRPGRESGRANPRHLHPARQLPGSIRPAVRRQPDAARLFRRAGPLPAGLPGLSAGSIRRPGLFRLRSSSPEEGRPVPAAGSSTSSPAQSGGARSPPSCNELSATKTSGSPESVFSVVAFAAAGGGGHRWGPSIAAEEDAVKNAQPGAGRCAGAAFDFRTGNRSPARRWWFGSVAGESTWPASPAGPDAVLVRWPHPH